MERLAFGNGWQVVSGGSDELPRSETTPPGREGAASPALERQDRTAFNGLLAFTFVLFVRPQDSLPFLEAFHLAELTAAFGLMALLGGRLGQGRPLVRPNTALLLVVGLGCVMLATAPFSVWPGGAVSLFTDVYVKVILIFALMVETVTTRSRFERLVQVIVLGASYIAVRAVLDYFRGINLHEGGRVGGAVSGLFGNPNDLALNMVSFFPLTIPLALRPRGSPVLRLLGLVGLPAMAATIVFTKSRGGTVALLVMLFVLLYQLRRVRPGVAVMVIAAGMAAIPLLPPSFTDRVYTIVNPEGEVYTEGDPYGSREARKRLLRDGYHAFLANPIFGIGAGQFMNYGNEDREEPWRETHNAVLQVASELGSAGLLIFVAMVATGFAAGMGTAAAVRRARRGRQSRAPDPKPHDREALELYGVAMIASVAGWFAAAMFASVAYYWTFYLVLGLAVSLREIALRETGAFAADARKPRRLQAA